MSRSVEDRVRDARAHAIKARDIACGVWLRGRLENPIGYSALLFHAAVIGEAVKFVPPDARALAPEIPWRSIAGMRDVIIHSYWQAREESVFHVIVQGLEPLIVALDHIMTTFDRLRS